MSLIQYTDVYDAFALGNYFRIRIDGKDIKLRIISMSIDFENIESCEITFADASIVTNEASKIGSTIKQAASLATSYETAKKQIDKNISISTAFNKMLDEGLSMTQTHIMSTNNAEVLFDNCGLLGRQFNTDTNNYEPSQTRLNGRGLLFTNDNWKTPNIAIGEIVWNGKQITGIIAKNLIGEMIIGNNLEISNQSGSYTITNDGFKMTQGTKYIEMNPSKPYFKLNNGSETLFDFNGDGNGNLTFGSSVKLNWANIEDQPDILDPNTVTEITRNTITTETLVANNLTAGSVITQTDEYRTAIQAGVMTIDYLKTDYKQPDYGEIVDIESIIDEDMFGLYMNASYNKTSSNASVLNYRYHSAFSPSTVLLYKNQQTISGRQSLQSTYMTPDGLFINNKKTTSSFVWGTEITSDHIKTIGNVIGYSPSYVSQIELSTGFQIDNSYISNVKKVLDTCVIAMKINGTVAPNAWTTIAKLPADCIPESGTPLFSIVTDVTGQYNCDLRIIGFNTSVSSDEGAIQILQHGSVAATKIHINISYPLLGI